MNKMEALGPRDVDVGKSFVLETALGDLLTACVARPEVKKAMDGLIMVIEERGMIPRRLIGSGKSQFEAWKTVLGAMAPIPGKILKERRAKNGEVIGSRTRALFQKEMDVAAKIISLAARVIGDYQFDNVTTMNQVKKEFHALRAREKTIKRPIDGYYGIVESLSEVVTKKL